MKQKENKMPFYCVECGLCKIYKEADENLKIINDCKYTRDIYCLKKKHIVHMI